VTGTDHVISFAGERLRILLVDEHPGLRFSRHSSGYHLETWLRGYKQKRSGLLGLLIGR